MAPNPGCDDDKPSRMLIQCSSCNKPGPSNRCSSCKVEYYCSVQCQKADRARHRDTCKALAVAVRGDKEKQDAEIAVATKILQDKRNPDYQCLNCLEKGINIVFTLECGHRFCCKCLDEVFEAGMIGNTVESTGCCPSCPMPLSAPQSILADRQVALRTLARNASDTKTRDDICQLAVNELQVVQELNPGNFTLWVGQGQTYMIMNQHEQAIKSLHKAYNARECFAPHEIRSEEDAEVAMSTEPSDSFDIGALSSNNAFFCRRNWGTMFCVSLARAYIQNGDYEDARKLINIADEMNKPRVTIERTQELKMDYDIIVLRAECSYHLGEYEESKMFVREAMSRVPWAPGLFKIYALCQKAQGDIAEAVNTMGKGYFREEPWNERVVQKNLEFWRELKEEASSQDR